MMKTFYVSVSIFITIITLFFFRNTSNFQKNIESIQLISRVDFLFDNGQIYERIDTVVLCYFNDLVIYREQYIYRKFNKNAIHGDTVIMSDDKTTIDFQEIRYDYYVWRNNATKGLKYSAKEDSIKVIDVDSIKIKKLFKRTEFYNIEHDKLESKTYSNDKKAFTEKYINILKPNDSYCDTTYYTFSSDFKTIPYSLSKTADSIRKYKLTEVRFIYNEVPKGIDGKIDIPKRQMIFKIVKIKLSDPSEFISISKKFNNDEKTFFLK